MVADIVGQLWSFAKPLPALPQVLELPMQHLFEDRLSAARHHGQDLKVQRYDLPEVGYPLMDAVRHPDLDEADLSRPDEVDDPTIFRSWMHGSSYHETRTPWEHGHDVLLGAKVPAEPDVLVLFRVRLRRMIQ